ncbi:MAG TPA: hypothetical protein VEK82_00405 [Stellaceae bacterium]|nr:hypothetical protein [Stellaceae bacterium]
MKRSDLPPGDAGHAAPRPGVSNRQGVTTPAPPLRAAKTKQRPASKGRVHKGRTRR